jgi:hypothetical protein
LHTVTLEFSDGGARIDAHIYDPVYGYSPQPTIEYRIATNNCNRSSPVKVYPNPASGIINIELETKAITRARFLQPNSRRNEEPVFDIRLYDGQGNMLRNASTQDSAVQFNVSNLPNGFYYLHIYDGVSDKPRMQQIIVEH